MLRVLSRLMKTFIFILAQVPAVEKFFLVLSLKKTKQNKEEKLKSNYY